MNQAVSFLQRLGEESKNSSGSLGGGTKGSASITDEAKRSFLSQKGLTNAEISETLCRIQNPLSPAASAAAAAASNGAISGVDSSAAAGSSGGSAGGGGGGTDLQYIYPPPNSLTGSAGGEGGGVISNQSSGGWFLF